VRPVERALRGAKNDLRLHALGIFSVAVAFLCLGATLLAVVNVDHARERWASFGRASVYLVRGARAEQVAAIERALRGSEGVTSVRHVSADDARKDVAEVGKDPLVDALPAEAFPESLEVSVQKDVRPERLEQLATELRSLPAVEGVETYAGWSERIESLLAGGVAAAGILALIVLAAVISVVSSTIRLSLQRRRLEVEVMKLVGATDGYVREPFVIEGAAQGALGASFAIALLAVLYLVVRSHLDQRLIALFGMAPAFLPWSLILVTVALGALLGAVAAFLSLRRFVTP
jgi:cell division transport system permease protein